MTKAEIKRLNHTVNSDLYNIVRHNFYLTNNKLSFLIWMQDDNNNDTIPILRKVLLQNEVEKVIANPFEWVKEQYKEAFVKVNNDNNNSTAFEILTNHATYLIKLTLPFITANIKVSEIGTSKPGTYFIEHEDRHGDDAFLTLYLSKKDFLKATSEEAKKFHEQAALNFAKKVGLKCDVWIDETNKVVGWSLKK